MFFDEVKQLDCNRFEEACESLESEFKFFSVASDITSSVKKLILQIMKTWFLHFQIILSELALKIRLSHLKC